MKKVDIKKRIKLLSWTSLIGILFLTTVTIYNAVTYIKNLEEVKVIVKLINQNTSDKLKGEVLNVISSNISDMQLVVLLSAIVGFLLLGLVIYLGVSIKKETNKRIHAMDWIIED